MSAAIVRPTDEYDRPLYLDHETPPPLAAFAIWRGNVCAPDPGNPGRTVTPVHSRRDLKCIGGWVRSGDWWLHCGDCRPTQNGSPGADR